MPTPIEKASFEATMRAIRKLYSRHVKGEINASTFASRSKGLVNQLKWNHVRALVNDTALKAIAELEAYQKQFGLSLTFEHSLFYQRGVKANISIGLDRKVYGEIFIGPRFHWNQVAIHLPDDEGGFFGPNLYTKRMAKRWTSIEDFDFPSYLHQLKEHIETVRSEERERQRRIDNGEVSHYDEIPF